MKALTFIENITVRYLCQWTTH